MVLSTKVNGKMTNKTVKELNHGQMGLRMKESIDMGKNVVMVNLNGLMVLYMRDNS
jgi:hypothetical protein